MRLLFCSAQIPSHLDWGGLLKTAVELAQAGHQVLWISGQGVAKRITAAGLAFQPIHETGWRWPPPPPLPGPDASDAAAVAAWQQQRGLRALDQWLDPARVAAAVEEMTPLAASFRPDAVVSEPFMAAAGLVAERVGAAFVVAGWPAFANSGQAKEGLVEHARNRLQFLTSAFELQGRYWTPSGPPALYSPLLHVTFWSDTWYGSHALQPQTQHFGGIAPPPAAPDRGLPPAYQLPWVLITLGTTFNNDPNFFLAAAHAASRLGCLPIVVLGREQTPEDATWLRRLPHDAAVRSLIAFDAVLPHLSGAIHHGGSGTTHALVTYGVPQIVVPHAADQAYQATGVTNTGVGIAIPAKLVTVDALESALSAALPDRSDYRSNARRLKGEFAALGGVKGAATSIIDAIQSIPAVP
jgi:hypothetical protein